MDFFLGIIIGVVATNVYMTAKRSKGIKPKGRIDK